MRGQGGARKPLPSGIAEGARVPHKSKPNGLRHCRKAIHAARRKRTLTRADRQVCALTAVRRLCGISRFRTHKSKTQVLRLSGSRDDVPCGCRAEPANHCRQALPKAHACPTKASRTACAIAARQSSPTGETEPLQKQTVRFALLPVPGGCAAFAVSGLKGKSSDLRPRLLPVRCTARIFPCLPFPLVPAPEKGIFRPFPFSEKPGRTASGDGTGKVRFWSFCTKKNKKTG